MSPRTVTGVGLTAIAGLVAVVPLGAPADAAKETCDGARVTISWRDHDVGTHIIGTRERDVIEGGPEDEIITGGDGNDLVCAGDGDDRIIGGDGADRLLGEGDDDLFFPGPGDDSIDGGTNGAVRSMSRPGDLVTYEDATLDDPCDTPAETDPDDPNFPNETCLDELNAFLGETRAGPPHADGAGGHDVFAGVESLRGMRDTFSFLVGSGGPNVLIDGTRGSSLEGGEGNDLLYGLGGPDVLSGDAGDDFLDGGDDMEDGSDLLDGGDGTDTCVNANPDFVSNCEADTGCAPKRAPACERSEQVLFRFSVDGFPDHPFDDELPDDLVEVELKTRETRLVTNNEPGPFPYVAEGDIEMTNSYLSHGSGLTERSVELAPGAGRYAAQGDRAHDIERDVTFTVRVAKSDDPNCKAGRQGLLRFSVEKGRAQLEISDADCLAKRPLIWNKRSSYKSARIRRPEPVQ